jgi:hypothetical protein
VDLLENGRAAMDLMARDLAEAAPCDVSNAANFFVEIPQSSEPIYSLPLLQALPGTNVTPQEWTNYLQPFFFLTRPNGVWADRTWAGVGYYVVPDVEGVGVGTLYRYAATNDAPPSAGTAIVSPYSILSPSCFLISNYANSFATALETLRTDNSPVLWIAPLSTVTRVAEGVIDLRARPFATNGYPVISYPAGGYVYTVFGRTFASNSQYYAYPYNYPPQAITQATNHPNLSCPDGYDRCWFFSNALPAHVELELGILESQTYKSYKAIVSANPTAGALFLSNHAAQVHIFRQRVPLHNVDPSAY